MYGVLQTSDVWMWSNGQVRLQTSIKNLKWVTTVPETVLTANKSYSFLLENEHRNKPEMAIFEVAWWLMSIAKSAVPTNLSRYSVVFASC